MKRFQVLKSDASRWQRTVTPGRRQKDIEMMENHSLPLRFPKGVGVPLPGRGGGGKDRTLTPLAKAAIRLGLTDVTQGHESRKGACTRRAALTNGLRLALQ